MLNLYDPQFRADPYPMYAQLRATSPIIKIKAPLTGEAWAVTRYHDVAQLLTDSRLANDQRNTGRERSWLSTRMMPQLFRFLQDSMVSQDAPHHRRLRTLVHLVFTPQRIAQLTVHIEQLVDQLLDQLAKKPTADLLADFAQPLPLIVISEMMGVPEQDRLKFRDWSNAFLVAPSGGNIAMIQQLPNGYRMLKFFRHLIEMRRVNPQDDMLTALVEAEADGERLSQDELLSMIFLLLLAGHETTVNLIGNGMLSLLQHPDQLALLRSQPNLIDSAIEECLRYGNPVLHTNYRFAREDFELHGQPIRRGEPVLAFIASANRDETVFPNPDQFDITRSPNRHLAFGAGIHYCLGAPLARVESRLAITKLLERFPALRIANDPAQLAWRPSTGLHGLASLPVHLG